jgi:hypothetical protein
MDGYGTDRLAAKDAESAIVARIREDFNLAPILARAHYEQMARYFAEYGQVPTRPGELCYLAVDAVEPPARRLPPAGRSRCVWNLPRCRTNRCSAGLRRCGRAGWPGWRGRRACRGRC